MLVMEGLITLPGYDCTLSRCFYRTCEEYERSFRVSNRVHSVQGYCPPTVDESLATNVRTFFHGTELSDD